MSTMLKRWQKQTKPHKLTKSPCLLHVHMLYVGEVIANRKSCCVKHAKLRLLLCLLKCEHQKLRVCFDMTNHSLAEIMF